MHSRSRLLLLALLLVAGTLALAWEASAQEPVTSRFKLSIGGYIKPEFQYQTSQGARGFVGSFPSQANFGFRAVPQHNTLAGDNGVFIAAASESRFNFTLTAPDWRAIKSTAFMEMDFQHDNFATAARQGFIAGAGVGNPAPILANGGFRIRHAFFRLAGEGLGGSWNVLFGQTWNNFSMIPHYLGSSVSFGGAGILAGRGTQLRFQHTWRVLRDLSWENTIAANTPTSGFDEVPTGEIATRFIYTGWQGYQGGARRPLNFGFSAVVGRAKAAVEAQAVGSAAANTASGPGAKSISNTTWGIAGGIFLPILPGRSATDRTWALSVVSEAGYGEGVNTMIPGANPMPGAVVPSVGANSADPGGSFFHPGKCSLFINPGGAPVPLGSAAAACGGAQATELSLIKSNWVAWNAQFFLPYGFWLSGGQKLIWFSNVDNATDSTCITGANGACLVFLVPVTQGRSWLGPNPVAAQGAPIFNNASALFAGRDSNIKRMTYSFVSAFYDMTPNIRWGFEWGVHGTNRNDSAQDNQSHRWVFAGYFFF